MTRTSSNAGELQKVLIIDDDYDDRVFYKKILMDLPDTYEILEADNAIDGLLLQQSEHPDCILLDYLLPDANGLSYLSAPGKKDTPEHSAAIIMISGQGSEETAGRARELGAMDYIDKNHINRDLLLHAVHAAIERNRLQEELELCQHELQKAKTSSDEFLQIVTHDLKAPLRRIAMFCDILTQDTKSQLSEDSKTCCERLDVNSNRLQNLLTALHEYAQIPTTLPDQTALDLNDLMTELEETYAPVFAEKGGTFTRNDLPVVRGYRPLLRQLFCHLLDNALKYSPSTPPTINIQAQTSSGTCTLALQDTGSGIPAERLESVFTPFQRLHSADEIEGSGLGLATCAKIAACHGGRIWAESGPEGTGTTLYLTLPLQKDSTFV
ncbi:MAG: response regulator [Rhodospirillales bacterium]|nr:response regulator [Rhodospirillales bacterium]